MENKIISYYHCGKCLNNGQKDKISVGNTPKGFQIWCDNCNSNVLAIDLNGAKVLIDKSIKEKP